MQKKISKFSCLFRFGLFSLLFAKYFVQDGMVDGIDLDGIINTHSLKPKLMPINEEFGNL